MGAVHTLPQFAEDRRPGGVAFRTGSAHGIFIACGTERNVHVDDTLTAQEVDVVFGEIYGDKYEYA